jgi:hypothetical protein
VALLRTRAKRGASRNSSWLVLWREPRPYAVPRGKTLNGENQKRATGCILIQPGDPAWEFRFNEFSGYLDSPSYRGCVQRRCLHSKRLTTTRY